jgi:hypothetical protein
LATSPTVWNFELGITDERHVISGDRLRAARLQVGNGSLGAGNAVDLDVQALPGEEALGLGDVKAAFPGDRYRERQGYDHFLIIIRSPP